MDLSFLVSYLTDLLSSWFGAVAGVLGVVQIVEWISGRSIPLLGSRIKIIILTGCFIAAQTIVAKDLSDRLHKAQTSPEGLCGQLQKHIHNGEKLHSKLLSEDEATHFEGLFFWTQWFNDVDNTLSFHGDVPEGVDVRG